MDKKLSTYGMLLLGLMVVSKFWLTTDSTAMDVISQADEIVNMPIKESNFTSAINAETKSEYSEIKMLFAEADHQPDKSTFTFASNVEYEDVNDSEFTAEIEDLALEESGSQENTFGSREEDDLVAPMEHGSSSVVYNLLISSNESIKCKEDRGGIYPLDQGNTISNTMDRLFPRMAHQ